MRLDTAVRQAEVHVARRPSRSSCGIGLGGTIQPPSTSPELSALTRAVASFMKRNLTSPDLARRDSSQ